MDTQRTLDEWFALYGVSHCIKTNKAIHFLAVPSIYLSIMGLFRAIPASAVMALAAVGVSVLSMFIAHLAPPRFRQTNFSSLRTGIMAGSPCPIDVMRRGIDDMGMREVTISYGMTET